MPDRPRDLTGDAVADEGDRSTMWSRLACGAAIALILVPWWTGFVVIVQRLIR